MNESFFCFASEIKDVDAAVCSQTSQSSLIYILSLFERRFDTSGATTSKVYLTEAGTSSVLKRQVGNWNLRRYWLLPEQEPKPIEMSSLSAVADEFKDYCIIRQASTKNAIDPLPVAKWWNGFIQHCSYDAQAESSSNASHIPRNFSGFILWPWRRFLDESGFAESVSQRFDVHCKKSKWKTTLADLIPATLWHNDEPIESLNRCVHWYLMRGFRRKKS